MANEITALRTYGSTVTAPDPLMIGLGVGVSLLASAGMVIQDSSTNHKATSTPFTNERGVPISRIVDDYQVTGSIKATMFRAEQPILLLPEHHSIPWGGTADLAFIQVLDLGIWAQDNSMSLQAPLANPTAPAAPYSSPFQLRPLSGNSRPSSPNVRICIHDKSVSRKGGKEGSRALAEMSFNWYPIFYAENTSTYEPYLTGSHFAD